MRPAFRSQSAGYLIAVAGIALTTVVLTPIRAHVNTTTVALALLLVVVFVASVWGSKPALLASFLGMACFNFFFLPPVGTFHIADPDNWIALTAFLITAVTVGQLSARAKQRTEEADAARRESERLYYELQDTFERSSQAKALKQSEKLKSALLDAVTHDLRTPLTSIKASATALLEEARMKDNDERAAHLDAAGRKELLDVINEEADRLDHFIEGLMELARIEAGEMQLRRQWGSVQEIIRSAVQRAAPLTRDHHLVTKFADDLPAVRVDERAVAEVLYTLIDNASKYSPAGTSIRIDASAGAEGTVVLIVEDQGPGIPAHLRERVFDKFFRATQDGDSGTGRPSGSGMGLAIAKGIVDAHGGRIWIESANGYPGTRVIVMLTTGDEA